MPNVNAQSLHISARVVRLGRLKQLAMGHHLARVQHELMQEPVFARRELWILAGHPDDAFGEIHMETTIVINRRDALHLDAVAQRRPHPRHKLGQKVICAEIECPHLPRLFVERRENQDRRFAECNERSDDVRAVAIGKPKIEHHEVRSQLLGDGSRFVARLPCERPALPRSAAGAREPTNGRAAPRWGSPMHHSAWARLKDG